MSRAKTSISSSSQHASPISMRPNSAQEKPQKSLLWSELSTNLTKRKQKLHRLAELANHESSTQLALKRLMLELRQITFRVIEDSIEVNARNRKLRTLVHTSSHKLPKVPNATKINEELDLHQVVEIISDTDDILAMGQFMEILPSHFPRRRNPFFVSETVDVLARAPIPEPQHGHIEEELQVLELERYKRFSVELLRAEIQIQNNLHIHLEELDDVWDQLHTNQHLNQFIRIVLNLLHLEHDYDPDDTTHFDLGLLKDTPIEIQTFEVLQQLNTYGSRRELHVEVKHMIRTQLQGCAFDILKKHRGLPYLIDFVSGALGILIMKPVVVNEDGSIMHAGNGGLGGSGYGGDVGGLGSPLGRSGSVKSTSRSTRSILKSSAASYRSNRSSPSRSSPSRSPSKERTGTSQPKTTIQLEPFVSDDQEEKSHYDAKFVAETVDSHDIYGLKDFRDAAILPHMKLRHTAADRREAEASVGSRVVTNLTKKFAAEGGKKKKKYGPADISRMVKEEMNKILKSKQMVSDKMNKDEAAESDTLSSLRYELLKIQRELLRRNVLDTRYYNAMSVDALNAEARGATSTNLDVKEPKPALTFSRILKESITLGDQTAGEIDVLLDVRGDSVLVQVMKFTKLDDNDEEIDAEMLASGDAIVTRVVPETLFTLRVSRLIISRLTKFTLDEIVECNQRDRFVRLELLLNQVRAQAVKVPLFRGKLICEVDRVLLKMTKQENNIIADLTISRKVDCSGLQLLLTPVNLMAIPITISVTDKELQVLLINQRNMYLLSKRKWSAMELLAQWLSTRVCVNKIDMIGPPTKSLMPDGAPSIPTPAGDNEHKASSFPGISSKGGSRPKTPSDGKNLYENVIVAPSLKPHFLLDMQIDRTVDLAKAAVVQFVNRNVPSMAGLSADLTAYQDLGILCMKVRLTVPIAQKPKEKSTKTLIDFSRETSSYINPDFSDDEPFEEKLESKPEPIGGFAKLADIAPKTKDIDLVYKLTGNECEVFGLAEYSQEHQVSLSAASQGDHPSSFVWNIISRMTVQFQGNLDDPFSKACSAEIPTNWCLKYDRKLLRDIRTISGGVVIITVSAIGDELLYEAEPTSGSIFKQVDSKLMTETDIEDMVNAEGWPHSTLEFENRTRLAYRILDRLKVVYELTRHRLEVSSYAETRIVEVIKQGGYGRPHVSIGSVEINSHHTLSDLRAIINHELDKESVPKYFKFMYKGSPCAIKQEAFRKAWEVYPKCFLMAKSVNKVTENGQVDESADKSSKAGSRATTAKEKGEGKEEEAQAAKDGEGNGPPVREKRNLVAIPLSTLGLIREGSDKLYLLHPFKDYLQAGDVVRIGDVRGKDYYISMRSRAMQRAYPKTVKLEAPFDLKAETNFESVLQGPSPFPEFSGYYRGKFVLNLLADMGFSYDIKDPTGGIHFSENSDTDSKKRRKDRSSRSRSKNSRGKSVSIGITEDASPNSSPGRTRPGTSASISSDAPQKLLSAGSMGSVSLDGKDSVGSLSPRSTRPTTTETLDGGLASISIDSTNGDLSQGSLEKPEEIGPSYKAEREKGMGRWFSQVWVWKCIDPALDTRPRWRRQFDNGMIRYPYNYEESTEGVTHFRVKAKFSYLEVLCTDVRCPDMSQYHQRINEMPSFTTEYYMKLAYVNMTEWFPIFKRGLDMVKLLRLIVDTKIFPDIRESARVNQLDQIFLTEVHGDEGLIDKYITYQGFCNFVKEVALLRFPQPLFYEGGKTGGQGAAGGEEGKEASGTAAEMSAERGGTAGGLSNAVGPAAVADKAAKKRPALLNRRAAANQKVKPKDKREDLSKRGKTKEKPPVDPQYAIEAYDKFVVEFIAAHPNWSEEPWKESKITAMKKEAYRYCAATRIIAKWRGGHVRYHYVRFVDNMIKLQALIRRRIAMKRTRNLVRMLIEDWLLRIRHDYVTKINACVRRYLKRCLYIRVLEKIRQQEIVMLKARRFKMRKLHMKEKKGIIFKSVKRVGGLMCILSMKRQDGRNYSQDYSMIFKAYLPMYQTTTTFNLPEALYRKYMQVELNVPVVSVGDLVDKRNIEKLVASRLILIRSKRPKEPPRLLLSKQTLGQRGAKVLIRGRLINKDLFVCTVYFTGGIITFEAYHSFTSRTFNANIQMDQLKLFYMEENGVDPLTTVDPVKELPLLHTDNRKELFKWAVDQLVIDRRWGQFKVMLKCQMEKSIKMTMIILIQSVFRRALNRRFIIDIFEKNWVKVKSSFEEDADCYYLNVYTGESTWKKPFLLGQWDLPTQPSYRWVLYNYSIDGYWYQQYVNPLTGRYTHLSTDEAASIIQRLMRFHLSKLLYMTLPEIAKVHSLENNCEAIYEANRNRLASVINYALVQHALEHQDNQAKKIYTEAIALSEANALVTRASSVFNLCTLEPPIQVVRQRAEISLGGAKNRDPTASKFHNAHLFFRLACLCQPFNQRALTNLAVVEALIYNTVKRAEKLFRRALAYAPFDERVLEMWNYCKEQFDMSEKHLAYYPKSKFELPASGEDVKLRVVHGRPLVENAQWAGWGYCKEDTYYVSKQFFDLPYWYNPADGTETLEMPDFAAEWKIRRARSQHIELEGGLELYYDPLTACHFQYHPLTNTYT